MIWMIDGELRIEPNCISTFSNISTSSNYCL